MKVTRALWGTILLLINLPPMAHPEGSYSSASVSPHSSASTTPPNSPGTPIGSLSRNMVPTDGAAGLFTPNTLGNAAALNAQLNGGLTASPIVDGNGANVHVTVPISTPPADAKNGSDGMLNNAATAARANSDLIMSPMFSNSMAPPPVARQFTRIERTPVTLRRFAMTKPIITSRSAGLSERVITTTPPTDTLDSIGQLTGSITYENGMKVLIGTEGNAVIDPSKGTLTLPNGARLSMKSAAKSVRQAALKNQVRL